VWKILPLKGVPRKHLGIRLNTGVSDLQAEALDSSMMWSDGGLLHSNVARETRATGN